MAGLTEEQVRAMGGVIVPSQGQSQGLTEDQVRAMGGTIVDGGAYNPFTYMTGETNGRAQERVATPVSDTDLRRASSNQQIYSDINKTSKQIDFGDSTLANIAEKPVNWAKDIAIGGLKSVVGATDFVATGLNWLTGNTLLDNPGFQFGTASRKMKNDQLYRGSNPAQKLGATAADIAMIAGTAGVGGTVTGGIKAVPAVTRAAQSEGKILSTIAKYAPRVAGEITHGSLISGMQGDEYTAGNAALDAVTPAVLDSAYKFLNSAYRESSQLKKIKEKIATDPKFAEEVQKAKEGLYKVFSDNINSKAIAKTAEEIGENADGAQNAIADSILFADKPPSVEGGRFTTKSAQEYAVNARNKVAQAMKLFGKSVDDLGATPKLNKQQSDEAWKGLLNNVSARLTQPGAESIASHEVNSTIESLFKKASQDNFSLHSLIDFALSTSSQYSQGADGISSKVFYQVRNAVREEIAKRLSTVAPEASEQFTRLYKDYKDYSIAASFLDKINMSKASPDEFFTKNTTQNIAGFLSTMANGGVFNFARFYIAQKGSGLLYDLFVRAGINTKLSGKEIKMALDQLGYQGVEEKTISELSNLFDKIKAAKTEQDAVSAMQKAEQAIEQQKAAKATEKKKLKDYWMNEPYPNKLPSIDYGPEAVSKFKKGTRGLPTIR